jgi:nitrous oxidase accessory protein NosD
MILIIQRAFIIIILLQFLLSPQILGFQTQDLPFNDLLNNSSDPIENGFNGLLQQLIDNAHSNDTLIIPNGTFYEHLFINKPITLIGQENTIIDGSYQENVVTILSNNVTITNIQFCNTGGDTLDSGIYGRGTNIIINNCSFYYSKQGIYLENASNSSINSCSFYQIGRALSLIESNLISITNCSFVHSALGILIDQSSQIDVCLSFFCTNGISLYTLNSKQVTLSHLYVKDNSDNHGGIFFQGTSSVLLTKSTIEHNGIGINIDHSDHVTINESCITNNTHFGILLREHAEQISITDCLITNNFRYGIYGYDQISAIILRNSISNNLLFGLYSIDPVYVLDQNWWDSSRGPTISPFRQNERVSLNNFLLHYNRWSSEAYHFDFMEPIPNYFSDDWITIRQNMSPYIQGVDSDEDGAPDWWEEKWGYPTYIENNHIEIDEDEDGLNNIEECYTDQWGSNPFKKDLFIEIDWIETEKPLYSNKPASNLLQQLIDNFALYNITLHIDEGSFGGGGEIPVQNGNDFSTMIDIYWDYFLNKQINHPRKGIFHYVIIANECADVNYPFFGWDQFDGIAVSVQKAKQGSPQYSRQMIIVGGILHQLGSCMELLAETHQGNDNWLASSIGSIEWLKYHQYKSSMNYLYKYRVLSFSDGSHGRWDFNDWSHLNFSFFKDTSFYVSN